MGRIHVFDDFSTAFGKSGAVSSSYLKGRFCAKTIHDTKRHTTKR
jgi:hypothetical protein